MTQHSKAKQITGAEQAELMAIVQRAIEVGCSATYEYKFFSTASGAYKEQKLTFTWIESV